MTRFLRGVGALGVLVTLVIGAPVALLRIGRWDALSRIDWGSLASTPDTGALLLWLFTAVGWVAWAVFCLGLVVELFSAVTRGSIAIELPGIGWVQPIAATLLVAVAGMVVTPGAAVADPVPVQSGVVSPGGGGHVEPVVQNPVAGPGGTSTESAWAASETRVIHTIVAGDDLWSLAEQHYGDGTKWRDIAAANSLEADSLLLPGDTLVLPGLSVKESQSVPAKTESRHGSQVTVRSGDSLSSIARRHLGDPDRWRDIARINADKITDPNVIEPGWVLTLPSDEAVAPAAAAAVHKEPAPSAATAPTVATTGADLAVHDSQEDLATAPAAAAPVEEVAHHDAAQSHEVEVSTSSDPARQLVGPISGLLAMAVVGAIGTRRRGQLALRAPGRRISHASQDVQRFETALEQLASRVEAPTETWNPCTVAVGYNDDEPVLLDLEAAVTTALVGDDELTRSAMASMLTSLALADWSAETQVVVCGPDLGWLDRLDEPGLSSIETTEDAVVALERSAAARRIALGQGDLEELRRSPETAEAWVGIVHLFTEPLTDQQWGRITTALRCDDLAPIGVGMSAVVLGGCPPAAAGEVVRLDEADAHLEVSGRHCIAQMIERPARRALMELLETSSSVETSPAPWWSDEPTPTSLQLLETTSFRPDEEKFVNFEDNPHPTLLLLGPVQLVGARGIEPTRAKGSCAEYCAWIHANPGRTAPAMNRELMVADSTRRSNMSRLRSWLGSDDEGMPYLPDAYSGRIALHPAVGTDWEQLQLLVVSGVNNTPTDTLVEALSIVRGAPLADAVPGAWHWAEEMRTDMVSLIRDIGVVLGERAIDAGDLDLARWAVSRALRAAPEDELLMCIRIRTEHLAGNRADVDRLILHLTRSARILGVDLALATVELLQEIVEGQRRISVI